MPSFNLWTARILHVLLILLSVQQALAMAISSVPDFLPKSWAPAIIGVGVVLQALVGNIQHHSTPEGTKIPPEEKP